MREPDDTYLKGTHRPKNVAGSLNEHLRANGVERYPCIEMYEYHKSIQYPSGELKLYDYDFGITRKPEDVFEYYGIDEYFDTPSERFMASILMHMGMPTNPPLSLLSENKRKAKKAMGTALKFQKAAMKDYESNTGKRMILEALI